MLAWVNGRCTDKRFEKLLDLLKDTPISQYYTDDGGAYSRLLPSSMHTSRKKTKLGKLSVRISMLELI